MRHLDEGTIHAWLDGALSEEKAHQAEEHAARCTTCAVAVADARGLIAASSRILLALDDVPRGVIPSRERTLPTAAPLAPSRALYQPWMLKAAASVVVVGATALLLSRGAGSRTESRAKVAESTTDAVASTGGAAAVPAPAPAPEAVNAPTAELPTGVRLASPTATISDQKTDALQKAKSADAVGAVDFAAKSPAEPAAGAGGTLAPAAAPARQLAAAPAPESARLDSAAAAPLSNQVASVPPKIAVVQAGAPAAGVTKRSIGAQDAALVPGMRIVSEQTITAQARVVQKRVYEVSPGIEVTYSIFEPVVERDQATASAAPANDSEAKDEAADSDAGVNTIKWSDSTGTDFMLSGRLPLDSLRAIRSKLPPLRQQ